MKTLYIVAGPTASGKTSFAIELALKLSTEIVSADSRQIFKEMDIGVARPTPTELATVRHHLIATRSVKEHYNVANYEKEALALMGNLFKNHDDVILCGGSGLYIDAVVNGIDEIPAVSEATKKELQELYGKQGVAGLQDLLLKLDPNYYKQVDLNNHRRLTRALEVCLESGKPFSSYRTGEKAKRDFTTKIFGLRRQREELIERIDQRTDLMISAGLEKEARELYPLKDLPALNTVGYKEFFSFFEGRTGRQEAVELIKIHSRQYAKRQMTWFNKTSGLTWIDLSKETDFKEIIEKIL